MMEIAAPRPVTPIGILSAHLESIRQQVDALPNADQALRDELRRACALASGLDTYVGQCTTPESAALATLVRRTQSENWGQRSSVGDTVKPLEQEMLSGHVEGQTLKFLVHLTQAQHVLEIGMFTGYSALAMAEALPENGELIACEVDAFAAAFAEDCFKLSPHGHKIGVKVAPALETLAALAAAGKTFELVFIDADKGGYIDYLNLLLETQLLAPNGLICVDNTLMQGEPYLAEAILAESMTANGAAIAAFNQAVVDDPRVEQVMLSIRDGLTLIRRVC
jgi:caffeoyl-CoA O-methyltransferase